MVLMRDAVITKSRRENGRIDKSSKIPDKNVLIEKEKGTNLFLFSSDVLQVLQTVFLIF